MTYFLDTNILLVFVRDHYNRDILKSNYDLFRDFNNPIISVVSVGEIKSIALRNRWGINKTSQLIKILAQLIIADINVEDVVNRYAEIEAFSQNKLAGKSLPVTARNMGKNDLWIAATASVLGAKLLTTDADFDHLDEFYLDLERIQLKKP